MSKMIDNVPPAQPDAKRRYLNIEHIQFNKRYFFEGFYKLYLPFVNNKMFLTIEIYVTEY